MQKPVSTRVQDWPARLRGCAAAVATGLLGAGIILILAALPVQAAPATNVNPGDSIQQAISNTADGGTVVINPGTYTESLTLSRMVSLTGVNMATVIIHAAPNQRVLTITGAIVCDEANIAGLTLIGGLVTGTLACPQSCGGGVAVLAGAAPHLHDLILKNNTAGYRGGGLYAESSPLVLDNVQVQNNTAGKQGGGLFANDSLTLTDSNFYSNTADIGGAANVTNGSLVVLRGRFEHNTAGGFGGALATGAGPNQIDGAYFANNAADQGSAIATQATTTISNTQFFDNLGSSSGAVQAIFNNVNLRVVNSLFDGNTTSLAGQGAGVYVNSNLGQVTLLHDTFAGFIINPGQAVAVISATAGISDSIFVRYGVAISVATSSAYADYNLFFLDPVKKVGAVAGGTHDVNSDPLFVNAPLDDYHLAAGSPAIDAGVNVGVYTDFEGDPRPIGAGFDIGFDERALQLWLPLMMR